VINSPLDTAQLRRLAVLANGKKGAFYRGATARGVDLSFGFKRLAHAVRIV
jgi:hypothetical protein